jgi:hypothetical protein
VTGSLFALLVLSILSTMVAVPPIMIAEWLFGSYITPPTDWGHSGGGNPEEEEGNRGKDLGEEGGGSNGGRGGGEGDEGEEEGGEGEKESLASDEEPAFVLTRVWDRFTRVLGCDQPGFVVAWQSRAERARMGRAYYMRQRVATEMGRVVMTVGEQRLEILAAIAGLEEDLGPEQV